MVSIIEKNRVLSMRANVFPFSSLARYLVYHAALGMQPSLHPTFEQILSARPCFSSLGDVSGLTPHSHTVASVTEEGMVMGSIQSSPLSSSVESHCCFGAFQVSGQARGPKECPASKSGERYKTKPIIPCSRAETTQ